MRIVLLSERNKSRSAGFAKEIRQQIKWIKRNAGINKDRSEKYIQVSCRDIRCSLYQYSVVGISTPPVSSPTSRFPLSSSMKLPRTTRGFQSVRKRIYLAVFIEKKIPYSNIFHVVHMWMAHVCVRVREENSIQLAEICAIEYFITLSSSNIISPVARCLSGVPTPFPSRRLSSNKFLTVLTAVVRQTRHWNTFVMC